MDSFLSRFVLIAATLCPSPHCLLIHDQGDGLGPRSATNGQPFDWVSVIDGPWRDCDEEDEGGATEGDPEGKLDVLEDVSD